MVASVGLPSKPTLGDGTSSDAVQTCPFPRVFEGHWQVYLTPVPSLKTSLAHLAPLATSQSLQWELENYFVWKVTTTPKRLLTLLR